MEITGPRVKCANCGMIYNKPPAEQVFWIGVPFTVSGMKVCPKCGSNASDPIAEQGGFTTNTTNGTAYCGWLRP